MARQSRNCHPASLALFFEPHQGRDRGRIDPRPMDIAHNIVDSRGERTDVVRKTLDIGIADRSVEIDQQGLIKETYLRIHSPIIAVSPNSSPPPNL